MVFLRTAVESGEISDDLLMRHSRWCHTTNAGAAEAAREAALAMYGFVPDRLLSEEGRPYRNTRAKLERYRERISRP